jgi:hypothetical protein
VEDPPLDVFDGLPGIALVPEPVEILCDPSKLDYEVAGEVFGLSLAALFPPEAEQGGLVVAHDDAGVGPPMKERLPAESAILSMCMSIAILQFGYPSKN